MDSLKRYPTCVSHRAILRKHLVLAPCRQALAQRLASIKYKMGNLQSVSYSWLLPVILQHAWLWHVETSSEMCRCTLQWILVNGDGRIRLQLLEYVIYGHWIYIYKIHIHWKLGFTHVGDCCYRATLVQSSQIKSEIWSEWINIQPLSLQCSPIHQIQGVLV